MTCDECGERVSAEAAACPHCGAPLEDDSAFDDTTIDDGIEEAADELRGDQWKTYLILSAAGVLVSGVLVVTIVRKAFTGSDELPQSAAYSNSIEGADGYLQGHVIPQIEMKFSTEGNPPFECKKQGDIESATAGEYTTAVRCESSEQELVIDVEILHDGDELSWETSIRESTSKANN